MLFSWDWEPSMATWLWQRKLLNYVIMIVDCLYICRIGLLTLFSIEITVAGADSGCELLPSLMMLHVGGQWPHLPWTVKILTMTMSFVNIFKIKMMYFVNIFTGKESTPGLLHGFHSYLWELSTKEYCHPHPQEYTCRLIYSSCSFWKHWM